MRKKAVFAFLTYLGAITPYAQTLKHPVAASYIGFGAYSLSHNDIFSFSSNQAALAQLKNIAVGIYSERRYLLNELSSYSMVSGLPARSGNFGLKTCYSGSASYNETQFGLAYGRKMGSKLDVGVQFNYNGIKIAGNGGASALSFEAGTIFHFTEKLHTGLHVNNPVGGKFGNDKEEKLPSVYTAGLGYDASQKFFISAEIIKEEDQPVNVNAGLQYKFTTRVLARLGISSANSSIWFGSGFYLRSFRLDVAASYHPQLGITPGLLLLFDFNKKEN